MLLGLHINFRANTIAKGISKCLSLQTYGESCFGQPPLGLGNRMVEALVAADR